MRTGAACFIAGWWSRREHEAEAELVDRLGDPLGLELEPEAERLEHVGRAPMPSETARLPCFATPAPAAAATIAAAVEMLNVPRAVAAGAGRIDEVVPLPACDRDGVLAHRLGAAGDLVDGLALRAQRREEGADLRGRRLAAHDLAHHTPRFRARETRARRPGGRSRPGWHSQTPPDYGNRRLTRARLHRYGDDPAQVVELFAPAGEPRGTAVVLHGGFWREAYDRHLMDDLCEDLAAVGWAAWNLEYRRLGGGGGWPATFDDVTAALDLVGSPAVTIGHSAGGHLALWAAGDPSVTRAVAQAGVVDLAEAIRLGLAAASRASCSATPARAPAPRLAGRALPLGVPQLLVHGTGTPSSPHR